MMKQGEQTMKTFLARSKAVLCGLAVTGLCNLPVAASAAEAQSGSAAFYAGKKVTIVIGASAGGGYDVYGRMIARYLPKHLAGNPAVVATNMVGAGSNAAAAYIANSAAKDGTYIGALYMGAIMEPLFYGKTRATHNPAEFKFIGSANTDYNVCAFRTDSPAKSFADAFDHEIVIGSNSPGGALYDFPLFLKELLGVKFKIVSGYPGSHEANLALESGEVQGICGQSWGGASILYERLIKSGLIRLVAQETNRPYPYLSSLGVPLARDFAKDDTQRKVMDLFYAQADFSRPYIVAKETPEPRVAELREAFMATMRDPELGAEAKRLGLDVDATPGEALQTKIKEIYAAPPEVSKAIQKIFAN